MAAAGVAELRAAAAGRGALESLLASSDFDPEQFTPADHAALRGAWAWLGVVAGKGLQGGPGGMIDDDLAYVAPWGFDPGQVSPPVLFLHGGEDRIAPSAHARWLARHVRSGELRLRPGYGHVSVLTCSPEALDWMREKANQA
jgi:pimeloyl-ACP methyl ester carboxylesterase